MASAVVAHAPARRSVHVLCPSIGAEVIKMYWQPQLWPFDTWVANIRKAFDDRARKRGRVLSATQLRDVSTVQYSLQFMPQNQYH